MGVHAKDGQMEIGIEAAAALGICQLKGHEMKWRSGRYLSAVTQIRGILFAEASQETVLVSWATVVCGDVWSALFVNRLIGMHLLEVKGNVVINPVLGMELMVPHQCVKIRSVGRAANVHHCLVAVRTSTRQMKMPGAI